MIWITLLIVALYARTWNYRYVVDDFVQRDGYLYDIPMEGPKPEFWNQGPSIWYRIFMVGMHCVNSFVVYLLWGWAPALLFAVHPLSVWTTAWVTGNYYGTTAYFILIAYYITHTFANANIALVVLTNAIGLLIYAAALNSTITSIGYAFFMLTSFPVGIVNFFPLAMFFTGKRFQTGYAIRTGFNAKPRCSQRFSFSRIALMTKVMSHYLYTIFVPDRLGVFTKYGDSLIDFPDRYAKMHSFNREFWLALAFLISVGTLGVLVNPIATLWFFIFMGVHSQYNVMGQFIAQRYLYLPMIGICVIAGTLLQNHPILLTIITTMLVFRTHLFIPSFKNQESLLRSDTENFPDFSHTWSNAAQFYLVEGKKLSPVRLREVSLWLHKAIVLEPESYMVQMNMAAYCAHIRQPMLALHHTEEAIKCLEVLGPGGRANLDKMYAQRVRINDYIEKLKQEEQKRLGESLSPSGSLNNGNPQHGETQNNGGRDGEIKRESAEVVERGRDTGYQGGEVGAGEFVKGG